MFILGMIAFTTICFFILRAFALKKWPMITDPDEWDIERGATKLFYDDRGAFMLCGLFVALILSIPISINTLGSWPSGYGIATGRVAAVWTDGVICPSAEVDIIYGDANGNRSSNFRMRASHPDDSLTVDYEKYLMNRYVEIKYTTWAGGLAPIWVGASGNQIIDIKQR